MRPTLYIAGILLLGTTLGSGDAVAQLISNPNFVQPPAKHGYHYPEYFCTDSEGRRVEIGETACLSIGARRLLARCTISVNSPAWREVAENCTAAPSKP